MIAGVYPLWNVDCEYENPVMTHYRPEEQISDWSVVIFPGGAYHHLAEHEGKGYAEFLNRNGINAFVVEYRVAPSHFPDQLLDARKAMRLVRHHGKEWGVNPSKVAVMGSSAGGHLAALVSTYTEELPEEATEALKDVPFLPDAQILCYPVIRVTADIGHVNSGENLFGDRYEQMKDDFCLDKLVRETTPRAFVWHTFTDDGVSVLNSLEYVKALREHDVSAEYHVFPCGPHGMGLAKDLNGRNGMDETAPEFVHVSQWGELLINWFKFIEK